jgi:hypothetical protein
MVRPVADPERGPRRPMADRTHECHHEGIRHDPQGGATDAGEGHDPPTARRTLGAAQARGE